MRVSRADVLTLQIIQSLVIFRLLVFQFFVLRVEANLIFWLFHVEILIKGHVEAFVVLPQFTFILILEVEEDAVCFYFLQVGLDIDNALQSVVGFVDIHILVKMMQIFQIG